MHHLNKIADVYLTYQGINAFGIQSKEDRKWRTEKLRSINWASGEKSSFLLQYP